MAMIPRLANPVRWRTKSWVKRDTQFPTIFYNVQRLAISIDNDKMISKPAKTKITSVFAKYCVVICKAPFILERVRLRESITQLWHFL